ncbi:MAG: type II toxin-antitoxin system VapC family toxin [Beijerinckiaceae bacterium]
MFFLDTNVINTVMNRRIEVIDARLQFEIVAGSRLVVPVPVLFELRYGAEKSQNPSRNHARIDEFLTAVTEIASFDDEDANEAGEIRAFLEMKGSPIGPYDLLIAAQTRRREAVLVTLNRREFERVPRLMVTDWLT